MAMTICCEITSNELCTEAAHIQISTLTVIAKDLDVSDSQVNITITLFLVFPIPLASSATTF